MLGDGSKRVQTITPGVRRMCYSLTETWIRLDIPFKMFLFLLPFLSSVYRTVNQVRKIFSVDNFYSSFFFCVNFFLMFCAKQVHYTYSAIYTLRFILWLEYTCYSGKQHNKAFKFPWPTIGLCCWGFSVRFEASSGGGVKTTGEAERSVERKVVGSFSTRTFAACFRCSTALIFIERPKESGVMY